MVLVDHQIKAAIQNEVLRIEPFIEDNLNPNSLDLTLGRGFRFQKGYEKVAIDPYSERDVTTGWVETDNNTIIKPGQLILGYSAEWVSLPKTICAELNGKSSLARLGLQIHQTGGWIDCGFEGHIVFEFGNLGLRPIKLIPGMTIGQIVFHETAEAEIGYGEKSNSKYQNQEGPVGSRYYLNQ